MRGSKCSCSAIDLVELKTIILHLPFVYMLLTYPFQVRVRACRLKHDKMCLLVSIHVLYFSRVLPCEPSH